MQSSYHSLPQEADESYDHSFDRFQDQENQESSSYSYGYNHYRPPPSSGIKGKVESKYWHTKQAVIQKLGKEQDEFVVAGDSEVDARLEAFRHIHNTCIDLLKAIEIYQNRIFALSQDENEMGRFLREQGSQDKSKAGKMMIAVGKSQSYTAQQRLSLRTPLVRLYQEIETFRFRAISDTAITITRMENSRTDYRASLLWMANISKELDPEEWKRLDKFREVQSKVKSGKKRFDKNKLDVMQKVDLLSASRCNLLSSTLASYQQAMLKFWENTCKSMNQIAEQFKGYPSYQFQMLKSLNPMMDPDEKSADDVKEIKIDEETHVDKKDTDIAEGGSEQREEHRNNVKNDDDDDDDKLICLDNSPAHEKPSDKEDDNLLETDLLGDDFMKPPSNAENGGQPQVDLLGGEEPGAVNTGSGDLLGSLDDSNPGLDPPSYEVAKDLWNLQGAYQSQGANSDGAVGEGQTSSGVTTDDLLFGSPSREAVNKTDLDLLSDIFGSNGQSTQGDNTFSSQWNELFGDSPKPPTASNSAQSDYQGYMPSDLMDSLANMDPFGSITEQGQNEPKPTSSATASGGHNLMSGKPGKPQSKGILKDVLGGKLVKEKGNKASGGDQSAWFNLFSDLDPLANPDAIGQGKKKEDERSC